MKYISEYRNIQTVKKLADSIHGIITGPHGIMEVCGGQTHTIMKYGICELLPPELNLIHGPGCPVCVTTADIVDKAVEIAMQKEVIFCTFGDMMRVPGTWKNLLSAKAEGGDVRVVYSPIDALNVAQKYPQKEVVFFAVGFETTVPAYALTVLNAKQKKIGNFSMLVSIMLIPPVMETLLKGQKCCIEGFLAPGHVCAVSGYTKYEEIAKEYNVPIVITGFEPVDILEGILNCLSMIESGKSQVLNQYSRCVLRDGNKTARKIIEQVFRIIYRRWRGLGGIPRSGLGLSTKYADFDAEMRFGPAEFHREVKNKCIAGSILQGLKKPLDCPVFDTECTPEHPLGATMVSSEGTCAAYHRFKSTKKLSSVSE